MKQLFIRKVSADKEDDILNTVFRCTINDFTDIINNQDHQRLIKRFKVNLDITATLRIYPFGVAQQYKSYISLLLQLKRKNQDHILAKCTTAVINNFGENLLKNNSGKLQKMRSDDAFGVMRVANSTWVLLSRNNVIRKKNLNIRLELTIKLTNFADPRNDQVFNGQDVEDLRKFLKTEGFGDTEMIIGGIKFYADRKILEDGNPVFRGLLRGPVTKDGAYVYEDIMPRGFEQMMVDCYLKGKRFEEESK